MNYKRLVGTILVIVVLCATLVSCSSPGVTPSSEVTPSPSSGGTVNEFEVIRQAADAYLGSGKAGKTILGQDLHALLYDDNPKNDPRVLEVRDFKQHILGHVCGAVNAPWRQFFLTLTPEKLDDVYFADHKTDNKQIVVYSYTGQEGGGQTTAFLNMLGFDAINLQWGYNVWQFCPNASPGAFFPAATGMGRVVTGVGFWAIGQNYPTETKVNEATKTYKFPIVENTTSDDPWEIIRAAATNWGLKLKPLTPAELAEGGAEQKHKPWDTDIIPEDLFKLLHDSNPSNDPFILDVRDSKLYAKGHIRGAINIPLTDVAKLENLKKLPPDRTIVVVSNDGISGNQVAGILAILGYNAVNLMFGMTAWTEDEEIAPGRFITYEADMMTFKDVLSYEICWIDVPAATMLPPIEGWQPPELDPVEIGEF